MSLLKEALDNLDNALNKLEAAVDASVDATTISQTQPQLDLRFAGEKDVNRKVAMKLDQTIEHLERLLSGE